MEIKMQSANNSIYDYLLIEKQSAKFNILETNNLMLSPCCFCRTRRKSPVVHGEVMVETYGTMECVQAFAKL